MALTQITSRTAPSHYPASRLPALRPTGASIAAGAVLLLATLALSIIVMAHPGPLPGDVGLTVWWQHLVRPHVAVRAALDEVSALNWPLYAGITVAAVVALFALLRRWLDVLILLGMEVADGSNWLLNTIVHRPRPVGYGVVVDRTITTYFSFPSGHVEHALAFLGLVVFLSFQVRRPAPWLRVVRWVARLVLVAEIVLQVPSRVLEGEHWPSDGLAGLLWGGFWLVVAIQVYRWAAGRWPRLLGRGEPQRALRTLTGA